jgi:hypothetical protein
MSNFGLLMIFIWGFGIHLSIAKLQKCKVVSDCNCEKLIYGCILDSMDGKTILLLMYLKDIMAGLFLGYGLNDWLFFIFFSIVFVPYTNKNNLK